MVCEEESRNRLDSCVRTAVKMGIKEVFAISFSVITTNALPSIRITYNPRSNNTNNKKTQQNYILIDDLIDRLKHFAKVIVSKRISTETALPDYVCVCVCNLVLFFIIITINQMLCSIIFGTY